jgi:hypothetical protein
VLSTQPTYRHASQTVGELKTGFPTHILHTNSPVTCKYNSRYPHDRRNNLHQCYYICYHRSCHHSSVTISIITLVNDVIIMTIW